MNPTISKKDHQRLLEWAIHDVQRQNKSSTVFGRNLWLTPIIIDGHF